LIGVIVTDHLTATDRPREQLDIILLYSNLFYALRVLYEATALQPWRYTTCVE